MWPAAWSLRRRLIAACLAVELLAVGAIVVASVQLLQRSLREQAHAQVTQITAMLTQAITAPLAQRDEATVQQFLDAVRDGREVVYLAVHDHREQLVAASGWPAGQALPPRDAGPIDLDRADHTMHLAARIELAGQQLGRLDIGLSTERLRAARADLVRRSVGIAVLAVVLSALLLGAIALAIMRGLARLARASQRVAEGDYAVDVPLGGGDELGRVARSFNLMAATVKARVAALERSEAAQREERTRLSSLLGALRLGIVLVDAQARVAYANEAFVQLWQLGESPAGRVAQELLAEIALQVHADDQRRLQLLAAPPSGAEEAELRLLDGRLVLQRAQPLTEGEGGWIWMQQDVTLDRQTQQRAHLALLDPLTRLLNRRGLYEALQTALRRAAHEGTSLALMFIDLDDFKHANDVGGHRMGDQILIAVARALAAQLRRGEPVARLGGDEFAVVCPGIKEAEAGAIAQRLVHAVAGLRFDAGSQVLRVGCSIGVALYPHDARNEDELIACADKAMYLAKRGGKCGWAAYRADAQESQAMRTHVDWNERIGRALIDQRFVLHFQGVHHAADLRVAHQEALLRMVDEGDGTRLVQPADFIAHAERSGKIRQIDRWVVSACVEHLARVPAQAKVAANLSPRSLEDHDFAAFVQGELQRRDVGAGRLHFELTETSALSDLPAARRMIAALRGLGCTVYLDDFGSGFNSFAQLKLLEVDALKIDGAFVRDLVGDQSNQLFVSAMIAVAHNLGKQVVAENVEDEPTLELLRKLGVDFVQGFHLSRPEVFNGEGAQRAVATDSAAATRRSQAAAPR